MLWELVDSTWKFPQWLVAGRTVLIPEADGPFDESKFRPITCLNTAPDGGGLEHYPDESR